MPNSLDVNAPNEWWQTPLGTIFLKSEAFEIDKVIQTLFGYHLLVLGASYFVQSVAQSPIKHRVWINPQTEHKEYSVVRSRHDKLPILADSVDLVYLAHCLEFINNPHEVLREVYRVLRPEGHVIIGNFNPWSSWGIWRFIVRYFKRAEWDGHFISVSRIQDWLALLGFDVVQIQPHFFRPPVAHQRFLERFAWLEKIGRVCCPFWSGGYVLLARKRVLTLTPIKPVFRKVDIKATDAVEPMGIE